MFYSDVYSIVVIVLLALQIHLLMFCYIYLPFDVVAAVVRAASVLAPVCVSVCDFLSVVYLISFSCQDEFFLKSHLLYCCYYIGNWTFPSFFYLFRYPPLLSVNANTPYLPKEIYLVVCICASDLLLFCFYFLLFCLLSVTPTTRNH